MPVMKELMVSNVKEIRVAALSRSGYHAIINWVALQFKGPICFLNWAMPGTNPFETTRSRPHETLDVPLFTKKDIYRGRRLLIYSYEDEPLEDVFKNVIFEKMHDIFVGKSLKRYDVVVIRDFFNTMASKLKLIENTDLINFIGLFKVLWKQYAKACLGYESILSEGGIKNIVIKFNEWVLSLEYRKNISDMFGLDFNDENYNKVSPYLGSSFDKMIYRNNASSMKVLERWKEYKNNYNNFIRLIDEEIIELNRELFGYMNGLNELEKIFLSVNEFVENKWRFEMSRNDDNNIDVGNENTFLREYMLDVEVPQDGGEFVLSVDIYPVVTPSHPDRHYGYWNKNITIPNGSHKTIKITWNLREKEVYFDGEKADDSWKGNFFDNGRYRVNFVFYKDGEKCHENSITETVYDDNVELYNNDEESILARPNQLKSAVWFLTWRCNNKCPYCWEVQRQKRGELIPEDFIDTTKWVNAWNRLCPSILDISGGEPWLQPGFIDMLMGFDDSIKIAITTNATKDLTEFVQKISPDKVVSMTLSYHPSQRMSYEYFLGKCLLLKNRGFNITVNFVTWPEQMWLIPELKERFEKYGIRFHVDPYAATPYSPYEFTEKEKEFLKNYVGEDRKNFFGEVDKSPVLCSGGYEHLNVLPNGDAYRCINDKIFSKPKIGNILDPDFELNKEWTYCSDYFRCSGCDKDKVRVKHLSNSTENKVV